MSLKSKIIAVISLIAALYLMIQGKRNHKIWICGIFKTYECSGMLNIITQIVVFFVIFLIIVYLILFSSKAFLKNTKRYIKEKKKQGKKIKENKKKAKQESKKLKEKELVEENGSENEEEINEEFEETKKHIEKPEESPETIRIDDPSRTEAEKEIDQLKTELREQEKGPKETIIKI